MKVMKEAYQKPDSDLKRGGNLLHDSGFNRNFTVLKEF